MQLKQSISCGLNKRFVSNFHVDSRDQNIHQPIRSEYKNKNEVNNLNTLNDQKENELLKY